MAKIEERIQKDGKPSYRVQIRKRGIDISRTFRNKDDAELYANYKERLIDLMSNFEVPLGDRVTLVNLLELKSKGETDRRTISEFNSCKNRFLEAFGKDRFMNSISYDEWVEVAKKLFNSDVYRGAMNEKNKRKMSPETLRRIFALISSCISHANKMGIELENIPLKVIQNHIIPLCKTKTV